MKATPTPNLSLPQVTPQPQETGGDQQHQRGGQIEGQKNKSGPALRHGASRQKHLPHAEQRQCRQ
jgi:hypothetical protein